MKIEIEMLDAAVNYWAGFLEDTSTSRFDNGDTSEQGAMMMMMSELSKPTSHPAEEVAAFKEQLKINILEEMPRNISVDYQPDHILGQAAESTPSKWSSMSTFPCKTSMYLSLDDGGEISVSQGYGAASVVIYKGKHNG